MNEGSKGKYIKSRHWFSLHESKKSRPYKRVKKSDTTFVCIIVKMIEMDWFARKRRHRFGLRMEPAYS